MPGPPRRLRLRDQAAEVARRPCISCRSRSRQQLLGRDPSLAALHLLRDQPGHRVIVVATVLAHRPRPSSATRLVRLDNPPDRLMRRAAHRGGAPVATHLPVGGQYVHPRRLWLAAEARSLGYGGTALVAAVTKVA